MADSDSRAGIRYASPAMIDWVNGTHARFDDVLETAFSSPDREAMPAIMVGASEAKFLQLLVSMVAAKKVVEVGTLAGFSAICMARGLPPDGHLWTIENEAHHVDVARRNIGCAGLEKVVTVIHDDAVSALEALSADGPFDCLFIDADKERYDHYGRWAAKSLRPGGLLIADNAYFFGNLLDDRPDAEAVRTFHREAALEFESVCLPTPDGMVLGIKKG
ncbi:MAG: O-methyltransferase [Pseudomonadota bacterium]|nr:O-methyltransferase [Pseudomonadota bacterium]MEE2789814.1 O-methyltransferase [Myxococcota bacterium]